jgi:phosphatidylinositol 3-kinase
VALAVGLVRLVKPGKASHHRSHWFALTMDKDNRDDFTFAKLENLKMQVTFRMSVVVVSSFSFLLCRENHRSQLEGTRKPKSFTELLEKPDLRFHGAQYP